MEGNVREISAKRMIREVIFVEDYDPDIEHEVDKKDEDLADYEGSRNVRLINEDNQNMMESEEEMQLDIKEIDQNDDLAEEEDISRPIMTRRGRIIKMPARFLFLTFLRIILRTASSTNNTSNTTVIDEEMIECSGIMDTLYGLCV